MGFEIYKRSDVNRKTFKPAKPQVSITTKTLNEEVELPILGISQQKLKINEINANY